jgi:hypothetical protein
VGKIDIHLSNKIIYSNHHSLERLPSWIDTIACAAAKLELWSSTSRSSWTLATGSMGRVECLRTLSLVHWVDTLIYILFKNQISEHGRNHNTYTPPFPVVSMECPPRHDESSSSKYIRKNPMAICHYCVTILLQFVSCVTIYIYSDSYSHI